MKKQIIRVLVLALAVFVIVLLHKRVRYEAEEAEKLAVEAMEQSSVITQDAQERSILRSGEGFSLGRMEKNEELGGVDIAVTNADGTETVYTFTDVAIDSWYADAVNFVVSAELMNGIANSRLFRPEYGMQRESFAAVLYRFAGGESAGSSDAEECFADAVEGQWYEDAVDWVAREDLMLPLGEGVFGIGEYMTCEQAIDGLYHLAGTPAPDGTLTDYPYVAKVSEQGRAAIDWAWKNGLITEDECVWYPTQAISRAQIALLLMRFSEKIS